MEQLSLILGISMEELRILPIPQTTWQSLPEGCLRRMLEFASVREEYRRTFEREPGDDLRDRSQRLALEDIMQLALINSREYQTQKERLYLAALALSLERFDYDLKFATSGNRAVVDYLDQPADVGRQSALDIRPSLAGESSAGHRRDFLGQFCQPGAPHLQRAERLRGGRRVRIAVRVLPADLSTRHCLGRADADGAQRGLRGPRLCPLPQNAVR